MHNLDWLLDSGPAIRWQAMHDLTEASPASRRAAGFEPDQRLADAIGIVGSKQQADGTWLLDARYAEGLAVSPHECIGEPSRWNTLRALRVLCWYDQAH